MTALRDWWEALSEREQRLLSIMLVALLLFIAYFFGFRGLNNYIRTADQRLNAAVTGYREIAEGAARFEQLRATGGRQARSSNSGETLQTVVLAQAVGHNINIQRLRARDSGAITFWIDQVSAPDLYAWLSDLYREHGILVSEAIISRNDDAGTVKVQVDLARPDA